MPVPVPVHAADPRSDAPASGDAGGQGGLPFADDDAVAGGALAQLLRSRALPAEPGAWDNLRADDGSLRPKWRAFCTAHPNDEAGDALAATLDRRVAEVAQRIRVDGVTHNVFGAAGAGSSAMRPWSLELLPQIIDAADWAAIESGIVQRALLLDRVLADVYGPQKLLREGLLPPALLLRHPGWLRPMVGVEPPLAMRLFLIAFDVARGADGRWWIVAQRTQAPSGLGYVLHNRLVISRQFPDAFRDLRVQHIASSYRRLLDTLEAAAREVAAGELPRIVLLTPGTYSETHFEHASLARYLGLPLVEGADLTVRADRLYLKTVEGLEPVHGVLRRVDDDWCDPLELRGDSTLGVPGLLQAVRAGRVAMANALGSGFLESPAIQGFLPAISRRLTGDDLRLPSLPTWWCGEAAAWADVRDRLDDKIVRSTFPANGRTSQVRPADAPPIDADPDAWTVQGRLRFARAPVWSRGAVHPRPAMVRLYAIAGGDGRWHVLPGGMTRVSLREDASMSLQRGGSSVDTWVRTDGAVDSFSMLPRRLGVDDIQRRRPPVGSRTGENLFWLGRYTERTEQLVRLARVALSIVDGDHDAPAAALSALSALAVRTGLAPEGVPTLVQSAHHFERALLAGLGDTKQPDSVASNLAALERVAQALRERLSSEHWNLLRTMRETFALAVEAPPGGVPARAVVQPALDRLALQLAAATGAQTDRMTRDHGWRLLAVGRLLERLLGLTARLGAFVDAGALAGDAGVELLLELFDSAITFRARYQRHDDLLAIADLLVFDSTNPRAFAGVLRRLRTELSKLPPARDAVGALADALPAVGGGLALDDLRDADDTAIAAALGATALRLSGAATALADAVGARYFTVVHDADRRV